MLSKGFLKPEISIDLIGQRRFWAGIVIGFGFAILISYFINLSREALRMLSFFREPYIINHVDFRLYDLFFAFFSTSIGTGITIIVWLFGREQISKIRYHKTYSMTYAWFIIILSLSIVTRFGSLVAFLLNNLFGYTKHFDFLRDYKLLLILIPIFIFTSQWNAVRRMVRMNNWTWFIFAFYLITSFYLFQTTKTDRNILNLPYYYHNKERFDYIDNELYKIERLGCTLKPDTKEILRKKHSEDVYELVEKLKHAFSDKNNVTIDTLILEKIVVYNLNRHNEGFYYRQKDRNWPYALPEEIYYQIQQHDVNSLETQVLFEILNGQIAILGVKQVDWEQRKLFTRADWEYYAPRWHILRTTETIQSRMIQVIDKLKSDIQYEKYYHLIPDIEMSSDFGRQEWYDIQL